MGSINNSSVHTLKKMFISELHNQVVNTQGHFSLRVFSFFTQDILINIMCLKYDRYAKVDFNLAFVKGHIQLVILNCNFTHSMYYLMLKPFFVARL